MRSNLLTGKCCDKPSAKASGMLHLTSCVSRPSATANFTRLELLAAHSYGMHTGCRIHTACNASLHEGLINLEGMEAAKQASAAVTHRAEMALHLNAQHISE